MVFVRYVHFYWEKQCFSHSQVYGEFTSIFNKRLVQKIQTVSVVQWLAGRLKWNRPLVQIKEMVFAASQLNM
jgi:hypothetical protein